MPRIQLPSAVLIALGAAALFGASTPLAKLLMGALPAMLVAGLLYLGSGIGLIAARMIRDRGWCRPELSAHDWPWLIGAIVIGGAIGPTLLMLGLARASAADTSLLLNLESVFTALLAWLAFREHISGRIVVGMLFIVAGSIALSWPSAAAAEGSWLGGLAVAGACLCWAIDNNLTRQVSGSDALFVAGSKGMVAGSINVALALGAGASLPPWHMTASMMLLGLFGYGISLVLFVHALRELGAARAGAYFAIAPFIGAAIAIVFFHESASTAFLAAAILMGIGVWIHLTERHVHEHAHDPLSHSHSHTHDEHHQHQHAFEWNGREAHGHQHNHAEIMHSHPHYPNIHHRHTHA